MTVHLTRIYTRTGDDGTTALAAGGRVAKTDPRLSAFGSCDEANTVIGVALALGGIPADVGALLRDIQNDLFDVGADLATPVDPDPRRPALRIVDADIARLEAAIDRYNEELPELASFVLPGGTPAAALLHQARAVVRRAERETWAAIAAYGDAVSRLPAQYLNRLSDLLFVLARYLNVRLGNGDILWQPAGSRRK
ncbi:MAG: cob(I)yrinic acid a,c-diamide adenosyltransferase [Acidothermus cellulolyticus]|nr:cob(I)yrinic acid a,c-diamide adenosyltransferase [Acidothermus cellulolyticus]